MVLRVSSGAGPVVLVALLAAGCGPRAVLRSGERQAISDAEVLGRAIFEQDRVSAVATDALRVAGGMGREHQPLGWVTVPTATGWRASFLARREGQVVVHAQVRFEQARSEEGYQLFPGRWYAVTPEPVSGGRPLDAEEQAWFTARQTALAHHLPPCARSYNPVVLPGSLAGQAGLLVYLLPAQERSTSWPFSFQRFLVAADGTQVLEALQLTRTCFTVEASGPEEEGKTGGLVVNHPLADTPQEHHVWVSLASGLPVAVMGADHSFWSVEGGVIRPFPRP